MKYLTDRSIAKSLLDLAYLSNPGPWVQHSIHVGRAAELLAMELAHNKVEVDPEIAYICGLMHDIGRYVGYTPSVIHSWDGYQYLSNLGYEGTAQTCVTHSFPIADPAYIVGWKELRGDVQSGLQHLLDELEWTLYDKIITLCDTLADSKGFSTIEKRIVSAAIRNGVTSKSPELWKGYFDIQNEIEAVIDQSIYRLLPEIEGSIYTPLALGN